MEGKVKWFNANKGFGFIITNEGNEVFVHYSSIISPTDRTLSKGQDVQFEITEGEQGPEACEVKATSE